MKREKRERGTQGMRGRKEEHLNAYLDQFTDTNFYNIFSSVSTGIRELRVVLEFVFLLDMKLCATKEKKKSCRIWLFQNKQECWADRSRGKQFSSHLTAPLVTVFFWNRSSFRTSWIWEGSKK